MKKLSIMLIMIGLLAGLAACDMSLAGDVTPPPGYNRPAAQPTTAPVEISMPEEIDLAAGASIYSEKCADCHGLQGLGDGVQAEALGVQVPPIGALEQGFQESPQEWFAVIRDGRMALMMPPFSGSLSDADIWNVLGYVYALGTDAEAAAVGEEIYGEYCAACHGQNGEGGAAPGAVSHQDAERMTKLSLADIIQKIATGTGNDDHAFANRLDAGQQEAAALYVRSLLFGNPGDALLADLPVDTPAVDEPPQTQEQPDESSSEEGEGRVVTGQVTNATGTGLPDGLEVLLKGYSASGDFELTLELSAPVAEDGTFRFENVPMQAGEAFIAWVEFQDLFYPSEFFVASDDDADVTFELEVYEKTTETSDLAIYRSHIFFEWVSSDVVQVRHELTIANRGTKTVVAPSQNEAVVYYNLPEGATNLVFGSGSLGAPFIATEDGFGDPRAIIPGEEVYGLSFAYELAYDRGLDWKLPVNLPTDFVAVIVAGDKVKLESAVLEAEAPQQMESGVYQILSASSLAVGDEIDLEISGRVRVDGGTGLLGEKSDIFVFVAGGLGILLIGYGVWQYLRPDKGREEIDDQLDTDALLDEIVALDEAFEAGQIDEEEYLAEREELKAQLRQAMEE